MSTFVKSMTKLGLVVASVSVLTMAGAQARPARGPAVPPTQTMTEQARSIDSQTVLASPGRDVPMCEASRIQVPEAGVGLAWATVEDCDQD